MEFHEKLQELRKERELTQEELAEALFVSRTAVSKWESGRGYPNIDSLKEISRFFSVSIDELLSGERLISLAEKENKARLKNLGYLLVGILDILSFALIVLPLYPRLSDGYIYSVNLLSFTDTSAFVLASYWGLFSALILTGLLEILFSKLKTEKGQRILTVVSFGLSALAVVFLAAAREPYALTLVFLLLFAKGIILFELK